MVPNYPPRFDWDVVWARNVAAAVTATITAMDALWSEITGIWPGSDRIRGLDIDAPPRAPLFPDVPLDARTTAWPEPNPAPTHRRRRPASVSSSSCTRTTARAPMARASWRGARRRRRRRLDGRGLAA